MRFRRPATRVQRVMVALMLIAYLALTVFLYPELLGVFSTAAEDTFSEWVWDLPAAWVYTISGFHILAGVAFIWSGGHFIEGHRRRRRKEKRRRSSVSHE